MNKTLPIIFRRFLVEIPKIRADQAPGAPPIDPRDLVGKGALYPISISSEEPADQWYWDLGLVEETLSHEPGAILLDRLSQNAPLLWNHDRDDQIGGVLNPAIDPKTNRLTANIRYLRTQRGMDFELGALDNILVCVSVGYRVYEMSLMQGGDVQKGEIDSWLVTKWEPLEVSIVSIPADTSVGVGRFQAEELLGRSNARQERFPVLIRDGLAVDKEGAMVPKGANQGAAGAEGSKAATDDLEGAASGTAVANRPEPPAAARAAAIEVGTETRDRQIADMLSMARRNEMMDQVGQAIERGLTPDQFAGEILRARAQVQVVNQPPAERMNAIPDKDLSKYSLRRAILISLPRSEGGLDWGGLEAEVHDELLRNLPKEGLKREVTGILVPTNIPGVDPRAAARAAKELGRAYPLDSATSGEGTEFKFTSAGPFIDQLRASLITARMGVRFLAGLPGPMGFPRQTAPTSATWQTAEATAVADSMPTFELMTLSPHTIIDTTGTTRQLLRMASEDFEALLRNDILQSHRVAIDTAFFVGTGASGQPSGVYVLTGVQSYDVGPGAGANAAPDYVDVTTMIGLAGDANVDDMGTAWATTPLVAATLMRTLTFPSANTGLPVWTGPRLGGALAGYPAYASNVLSKTLNNGVPTGGAEHGFVHGVFTEGYIGEFGVFEIIPDPYSSKKSGIIELTSFQMVDTNLRHPAAFVKGINAIP